MSSNGSDWAPDIFDFIDYRAYLRAYYEAGKAQTKRISFRYLAKRAGFSSPSYLRHVMQGERSLGLESVEKLVEALSLPDAEARYFRDLVAFGQAEGAEARTVAFERVASHRRFRQAKRIEGGLFRYLSRWYYPAIREMSALKGFDADPVKVAAQLLPQIRVHEAKEALETLFELGLLVRMEDGTVVRAEPTLSTEHEVRNLGIGNYHRQMLERAAASIELCQREFRDIAAMTVCVSHETIAELKRRVHEFRERLLELCDSDPDPKVVFQINTQLFPLSNPGPNDEDV